jgi:hypothetical protein
MMIDEIKISVVPEGTILESIHGICPKCSYNFEGEDVRSYFYREMKQRQPSLTEEQLQNESLEIAVQYGWTKEKPLKFSNIVGVEIPGSLDGTMFHQCPECETMWDRSGKEVTVTTDVKPDENLINGNTNTSNEIE